MGVFLASAFSTERYNLVYLAIIHYRNTSKYYRNTAKKLLDTNILMLSSLCCQGWQEPSGRVVVVVVTAFKKKPPMKGIYDRDVCLTCSLAAWMV